MAEAWLAEEREVLPGPDSTQWLGVRSVRLSEGEHTLTAGGPGAEVGVVLLAGQVEVKRGDVTFSLGPRQDPISELPWAAYLPVGAGEVTVRVDAPAWLCLAWAEGKEGFSPKRVTPADVQLEARGEGVTLREVRHVLEQEGEANRLLLVEVITPGGHWSSFPPHRHDEMRPPALYAMEEAYLFAIAPRGHRALMGTWTDAGEAKAFAVGDGDLVMVRRGYHTVSAAPGSTLYYLNAMAGPERVWTPQFQPGYEHLVTGWGNAPVARPEGDTREGMR